MKRQTQKEFIDKLKKKFKDKYTYEKTEFTNIRTKCIVTCKEHGDFVCDPRTIFRETSFGCNECKKKLGYKSKRLDKNKVILQFKEAHGDLYDYSKVDYVNTNTKVEIICKNHGSFFQIPKDHKKGFGCDKCGGTHSYTNEEFIKKAKEIHNDKYVYLSPYISAHKKIAILCEDHGIFRQLAYMHIQGQGCSECGLLKQTGREANSLKQTLERFKEVHGTTYDYSKVSLKYVKDTTPVEIICKVHGSFSQTPQHHKRGHGCSACTKAGFDNTKPTICYYLSINDGEAYKIGVTNRTVQDRFCNIDIAKIKVVATFAHNTGLEALRQEREVLKKYKEHKYTGKDLLQSGNTELFNIDVLGLDR